MVGNWALDCLRTLPCRSLAALGTFCCHTRGVVASGKANETRDTSVLIIQRSRRHSMEQAAPISVGFGIVVHSDGQIEVYDS